MLINKRFKIAKIVLKRLKKREVFQKLFFRDKCILKRNLKETSEDILIFWKLQISLTPIFLNFSSYLDLTEEPKDSWYMLSHINFLSKRFIRLIQSII